MQPLGPQDGQPPAFEAGAATVTKVINANAKTMSFFTVKSPFQRGLDRDNVAVKAGLPDHGCNAAIPLKAHRL
jgi:hypothetical protein